MFSLKVKINDKKISAKFYFNDSPNNNNLTLNSDSANSSNDIKVHFHVKNYLITYFYFTYSM